MLTRSSFPGTLAVCLCALLFLPTTQGCGSGGQPAPAPAPALLTMNIPVISPQRETQIRQPKGGLEISVTPVTYTVTTKENVTFAQFEPSAAQAIWNGTDPNLVFVERTAETVGQVQPQRLQFLVTITNQMPRVFHGAGTVVQFNVGGKLVAVDQQGYSNFTGAIIPPRQQQQLLISGPPISEVDSKGGIMGVFLYDVVTKQSDAGVVTEKQNYEWFFDYTMTPKQVEVPAKRVQQIRMYRDEYDRVMAAQSDERQSPQDISAQ